MTTVQANYNMHPYYDGLINVGEPKPSREAQDGGYVGDKRSRENLADAEIKLAYLLEQGKTFDDSEVQKLFYEILYWENMLSASTNYSEKELMKDPSLAKTAHEEAHEKAVESSNIFSNQGNEPAQKTGEAASAEIKELMSYLDQSGLGRHKSEFLSMLKNRWKGKIKTLEEKVFNNKATNEEKEELANLKGSLAVLEKFNERNGTTNLSDERMNDIYNAAAKDGLYGVPDKYAEATDLAIPEYVDALSREGTKTGGYVSDNIAKQYVTEANNEIGSLKDQGKTINDPEIQKAVFELKYWGKRLEFAELYGEKALKNDPETAQALNNAALAYAKGEVIRAVSKYSTPDMDTAEQDSASGIPFLNRTNSINKTNLDVEGYEQDKQEDEEGLEATRDTKSALSLSSSGNRPSPVGRVESSDTTDSDEMERLSGGKFRAGDHVYANAFQYAEAIFSDVAYLMQDLLVTKVEELKIKKNEVSQANEALAALNGAEKSGSKGKNIIKVKENATEEEAKLAEKEGRWFARNGKNSKFGDEGTFRVQTKESKKFNDFVNKEIGMNLDSHYITNEQYEKLKTKLESYISSRQTDMQQLSTEIQRLKDKFDQMWRLVGGLITMQGDLNKTLVGNIR